MSYQHATLREHAARTIVLTMILDTRARHAHNRPIMPTLRIHGAIDRASPDPESPHNPGSTWIGMVAVDWADGYRSDAKARAAILKAATGRGGGDDVWGQYVPVLRWIGDPPPAEVTQAVYDIIRDGGPSQRSLSSAWESQPASQTQPSYRSVRPS